jgi:hypothetical protein
MFSTRSKSQNQVKISIFLTILGITRKVIIIEEWTKHLTNLVLYYGYIKKRITKIRQQISVLRPAEVHPSARSWPGEGGAILQWLYFLRSDFGKTRTWNFYGWIVQKSPPRTPSDFLQQALGHKGLLEYGLKFGENCSPPTKTKIKNGGGQKNFFFETSF